MIVRFPFLKIVSDERFQWKCVWWWRAVRTTVGKLNNKVSLTEPSARWTRSWTSPLRSAAPHGDEWCERGAPGRPGDTLERCRRAARDALSGARNNRWNQLLREPRWLSGGAVYGLGPDTGPEPSSQGPHGCKVSIWPCEDNEVYLQSVMQRNVYVCIGSVSGWRLRDGNMELIVTFLCFHPFGFINTSDML